VVIRFAGDSGDGMQLTGNQFKHHLRPDGQRPLDPAGLPGRDPRPQGTLPGVSAFQVRIADYDIHTRATPRTCWWR